MGLDNNVLDLRGFEALIPYRDLEKNLRRSGEIVISIDKVAWNLVKIWAQKRGYIVEEIDENTLRIRVASRPMQKPIAGEEAALIAGSEWDKDLSRRLADVSRIVKIVLKARVVYRGKADKEAILRLLGERKPLILRINIGGSDYFFLAREARIIAAAKLGSPLNNVQAKNIIESAFMSDTASLTIYDISDIPI